MNAVIRTITVSALLGLASATVNAHCQIPCGIYDDQMRIQLMEEHVTTIEKAMRQISTKPDTNQAVRWVMNKEEHADKLSEIVTRYFMMQRIKPGCDDYALKLSQLHEILVYSMKSKQSTDMANVEKLRELIDAFERSYIKNNHNN